MHKQELIKAIAADAGVTQTAATAMLKSFEHNVSKALAAGDEVKMVGFGTWRTIAQSARTGRNPKTGEEIKVPAKVRVSFIAGKELKDAVNA